MSIKRTKLPPVSYDMQHFIRTVTGVSAPTAKTYEVLMRHANTKKFPLYGNHKAILDFHTVCGGVVPFTLSDAAKKLVIDASKLKALAIKSNITLPQFRDKVWVTNAQFQKLKDIVKAQNTVAIPPARPIAVVPAANPVTTAPISTVDSLSRMEKKMDRIEAKLDKLLLAWEIAV